MGWQVGTVLDCCSVVPSVLHSASAGSSTQMLTFFESIPHAPTNTGQVCIYLHPFRWLPLFMIGVMCHIRQPNMTGCFLAAGGSAARCSKKPCHSSGGKSNILSALSVWMYGLAAAKDLLRTRSRAAAFAGHCNAICGGGPINIVNAIQQ